MRVPLATHAAGMLLVTTGFPFTCLRPSKTPQKNVLSLRIGPPKAAPKSFRSYCGLRGQEDALAGLLAWQRAWESSKKFLASRTRFRRYSNTSP